MISAIAKRRSRGEGKPETFDFLGFAHICEINGKSGRLVVRRKTVRKRMRAKLAEMKNQLRARIDAPPGETGKWLRRVVRGYFPYHGAPGKRRMLAGFRWALARHWRRTPRRRGQKGRISWGRFYRLLDAYLPRPRCCHPFPSMCFAVTHPR